MHRTEAVLDQRQAKAVRVEIIYEGETPDELPEEWRDHLAEELARDIFRTFKELYSDLDHGDVLLITFSPKAGINVMLNDTSAMSSSGSNVIDALLELWGGSDPVSKNLKRLLLEVNC